MNILIGILLTLTKLATPLGTIIQEHRAFREEAIAHNCVAYNEKTGELEWVNM